ncbi:MAG: heme ABC exporter ATP-binding protein CcmA [Acidobacteria bacterium]|nr:MAG: heme ABC exporter ATP-binding protein CcmA [Acidobacteriota bacterium]
MQSAFSPEANLAKPDPSVAAPALHIRNLQYKIGFTSILKDISFDLKQGEVLALLGPNGAGKSTLLKCVAGLLPHTGDKLVLGQTLKKNYAMKRELGYLGHETFLYQKLNARENLHFYASLYGITCDADAILKEYSLLEAADQLVETYSRGMKQRLALARTLLSNPSLLLLDEPFTGLDQQASQLLESKILQLKGKTAVIAATHELDRAQQLCDRFCILKNGRTTFVGTLPEMNSSLPDFYRARTA